MDNTPGDRPRDTMTTEMLKEALTAIDAATLAQAIGVQQDRLERWAIGQEPMTFSQRMGTTMGVIALAPQGSNLFRRAALVRAQLAASIEFELGVTRTSMTPPRTTW